MNQAELFETLSSVSQKFSKFTSIDFRQQDGIIILRRRFAIRIIYSVSLLLFITGAVLILMLTDFMNSDRALFGKILFLLAPLFLLYELFIVNRNVRIDFNNRSFEFRFLFVNVNEYDFSEFQGLINETQVSNGKIAGYKLKLVFGAVDEKAHEIGHYKNQFEINEMVIFFNFIKAYIVEKKPSIS